MVPATVVMIAVVHQKSLINVSAMSAMENVGASMSNVKSYYVVVTPARGILGVFTSKKSALENAGSEDVISVVPASLLNQVLSIKDFTPPSAAVAVYGEYDGPDFQSEEVLEDYAGYEALMAAQDDEDRSYHAVQRNRREYNSEADVQALLASSAVPLSEDEEAELDNAYTQPAGLEAQPPSTVFQCGDGWMAPLSAT